jgi:hypothetical protein
MEVGGVKSKNIYVGVKTHAIEGEKLSIEGEKSPDN